ERNKESREGRSWLVRFIKPFAGVALVVAGIVFCLIPGPGLPLLLIGAGLLADVSLPVARAMDWTEVRVREVMEKVKRWWKGASMPAKSMVILISLFLLSGVGYGGFLLLQERMH
ncbi:MAG: hypothetical protein EOP88_04710, partial [Verrucomicrobiaceae bacterium]